MYISIGSFIWHIMLSLLIPYHVLDGKNPVIKKDEEYPAWVFDLTKKVCAHIYTYTCANKSIYCHIH